MVEKRVDPADGQAYTKSEFLSQYGGYAEWNAAQPVGGGAAAGGAAGGLAEQIKQMQRADIGFRDKWRVWCVANAGGNYDPARMTAAQLQSAMAACSGGSVRAGARTPAASVSVGGGGDWVQKVKDSCRSDPAFKVQWQKWCNEHADRKKDPANMDVATLKKAWGQCTRAVSGGGGGGRVAGGGGGRGGALRIDPADGNAYTREEFVAQYGGLAQWNAAPPASGGGRGRAPPRAAPYPGARGLGGGQSAGPTFQEALAARVQQKQKSDPEFRPKWVAHCDSKGCKYDPRLMTAGQIRTALEEIDGYDGPAAAVYAEIAQEKIKADPTFREKWKAYCEAHTGRTMDPRRLSHTEILEGLRAGGATGLRDAQTKARIATQVRDRQRDDKGFVQRWRDYCTVSCDKICDPAKLTLSQLNAALAAASNPSG